MLISKQQKFLLDALERLGCARTDQLAGLIRPVFCAGKPEIAPRLVASAMRQLEYCNAEITRDGDVYTVPGEHVDYDGLQAVDIMLQLSSGAVLDYRKGKWPVLLRFSIQEQKVRSFAVASYGSWAAKAHFTPCERIILLFDGRGQPEALPVSNKQFFAVRQEDGTHRFFALDGK